MQINQQQKIADEALRTLGLEELIPQDSAPKTQKKVKKKGKGKGKGSASKKRQQPEQKSLTVSKGETSQATGGESSVTVASTSQEETSQAAPEDWKGSDKTISTILGNLKKFRDSFDIEGEKVFVQKSLKEHKKKPFYGRICEEAAWTFLRATGVLTPNQKYMDRQTVFQQLSQVESLLKDALAQYTKTPINNPVTPEILETIISGYYKKNPEHAASAGYRTRLRSICSSFGHLYGHRAALSQGKKISTLSETARQYYNLKHIADPDYQSKHVPVQPPKIGVVSRETFSKLKDS